MCFKRFSCMLFANSKDHILLYAYTAQTEDAAFLKDATYLHNA